MSRKRARSEIEIPCHVLEEILARLPAKSLLRFTCLNTSWCSLIRSPSFISKHLLNHRASGFDHVLLNLRSEHLLLSSQIFPNPNVTNKFSLLESPDHNLSSNLNPNYNIQDPYIVGHYDGLVCFMTGLAEPLYDVVRPNLDLHLWNPATGQHKTLPKSNLRGGRRDCFGFGHDPKSRDYNVVRCAIFDSGMEAEVYSVRTYSWRPVVAPVALKCTPKTLSVGVCLHGFCCWMGRTFAAHESVIISYNLSNESFRQIHLPEQVYRCPPDQVRNMTAQLFVWKGSLTLAVSPRTSKVSFIDIWSFEVDGEGTLTLKEHQGLCLDLDLVKGIEFLWNDHLILTFRKGYDLAKLIQTRLKAYCISTSQIRDIPFVGVYDITSRIVGYTPSLVSL